jgi:hypothetical protein
MVKIDVMLDGPITNAAVRARELEALGVDGIFTFENAHDVFSPLLLQLRRPDLT